MSQLAIARSAPFGRMAPNSVSSQLAMVLREMFRAWQTRRNLPELTARELADIGVSRATALKEARRMPWDIAPLRHRL